jgi:hypothetical protein
MNQQQMITLVRVPMELKYPSSPIDTNFHKSRIRVRGFWYASTIHAHAAIDNISNGEETEHVIDDISALHNE